MRERIVVPPLGEGAGQVVVDHWHVRVGERVHAGQVLLELETDKASYEVRALVDGRLEARHLESGDTASEGDVLGSILVETPSVVPSIVESALRTASAEASPRSRPPPADAPGAVRYQVRVLTVPSVGDAPFDIEPGWEPFAALDDRRILVRRRH